MVEFKSLKVWSGAVDFAVGVDEIGEGFPKSEMCALIGQMRNVAISVFSNIAEGRRRMTDVKLKRN